ncbi:peptidoglycan DD-metalloendopeptidase family protein [Microgenomates group bacterium]|nr:peptidoglycan DD-metalloendopeptidase family protein [Microgenomates group bacterium]
MKKVLFLATILFSFLSSVAVRSVSAQCTLPIKEEFLRPGVSIGSYGGAFKSSRSSGARYHAGVDIFTAGRNYDVDANVYAIADGEIVEIVWNFINCTTNNTVHQTGGYAAGILVKHTINGVTRIVNYGEVDRGAIYNHIDSNAVPNTFKVGDKVRMGDVIGTARRCGMLHFELWDPASFRQWGLWYSGQSAPAGLLDPTQFLSNLYNRQCSFGDGSSSGGNFVEDPSASRLSGGLFIGDSITAGISSQLSAQGGIVNAVVSRPVSGSPSGLVTGSNLSADFTNFLSEHPEPSFIYIMLGVNSLHQTAEMKTLLTQLRARYPGTTIYYAKVLPTSTTFSGGASFLDDINDFNQEITNFASSQNITVIDVSSGLVDQYGYLSSAYSSDGVHLNTAGQNILFNNISQVITGSSSYTSSGILTSAVQTSSASICVGDCPAEGLFVSVDGKCFPVIGNYSFYDDYGASRGSGSTHKGTDIIADMGLPIVSISDGTITRIGWNKLGGWRISIQDSTSSNPPYYYAHMQRYADFLEQFRHMDGTVVDNPTINGQPVTVLAGQVIGYVGDTLDTGSGVGSTGGTIPHLHFSLNETTNPYQLLKELEASHTCQ